MFLKYIINLIAGMRQEIKKDQADLFVLYKRLLANEEKIKIEEIYKQHDL